MRDDDPETPKPKRPAPGAAPVLGLLGALLVGAAAGFAGARALPAAAPDAGSVEAPPGEPVAAPTSAVTSLGTFTVNLRGTGGARVLRLEVQVEGPAPEAETVTARAAQIRDSIITAVSDYTWAELEGAGGKTRLRDELLARVNGAAAPAAIERIYFTQFVVQ